MEFAIGEIMKIEGKLLITGGCGTLGRAIICRATEEEWNCDITVYSRDWNKHVELKREYPNVRTVLGDIIDPISLNMAIAGHDIVIHAAAMKHIVEGEKYPLSVIENNVNGSVNILEACVNQNVKHVVGISSDKASAPHNAYGASKMLMEKAFQQYSAMYDYTQFHLVRYGNVLGSTGSFIHNWLKQLIEKRPVWSTVPAMTRFWLTDNHAVDMILKCLGEPSGCIYIEKIKTASVEDLENWLLGKPADEHVGIRSGEKLHETLLTVEEGNYAEFIYPEGADLSTPAKHIRLWPTFTKPQKAGLTPKKSNNPNIRLTKKEFLEMLGMEEFGVENEL
jgi:UDP-N-acetylglucosamine 4,6-dehydratase